MAEKSLEQAFIDDFKEMWMLLRQRFGTKDPNQVPIPSDFKEKYVTNTNKLSFITNIEDAGIYNKLSNTECIVYNVKPLIPILNEVGRKSFEWKENGIKANNLYVKQLDHQGQYMKIDYKGYGLKNPYVEREEEKEVVELTELDLALMELEGKSMPNYENRPVYRYIPFSKKLLINYRTLKKTYKLLKEPHIEDFEDSILILSDCLIDVQNNLDKYYPGFYFIDVIENSENYDEDYNYVGGKGRKYLYFVPKKYIGDMNQTCLVLSNCQLDDHYGGRRLSFTNGQYFYLYIIDYGKASRRYKYEVLCTKVGLDYSEEINTLLKFWEKHGMLFNHHICKISLSSEQIQKAGSRGIDSIENLAYVDLEPKKTLFEKYKLNEDAATYNEDGNAFIGENYDKENNS